MSEEVTTSHLRRQLCLKTEATHAPRMSSLPHLQDTSVGVRAQRTSKDSTAGNVQLRHIGAELLDPIYSASTAEHLI